MKTRIPIATYRWQFNRPFTFRRALAEAEYLSDLGVSDAYASPLFQAGPESTHGYDICSFAEFNESLGARAEFDALAARLREIGLGLLLDMVPNHMRADLSNAAWVDVLENGKASRYSTWFDIDWRPLNSDLRDQVLLPTLEDSYAKVLEAGKLQVEFEAGAFALVYHERRFPLSARSAGRILDRVVGELRSRLGCAPLVSEVNVVIKALVRGAEQQADLAEVKKKLEQWHSRSVEWRAAMTEALRRLNGRAGEPRSFDTLADLLRSQHYRLAHWRIGSEAINYRRFFDVTELVGLRMELPEVFQETHALVFELVRTGKVTGLRIDHPDGLRDPKQYFERLQRDCGPVYVVAEKILVGDEPLPADWPVDGTTGYDFLNRLNGVFIDSSNRQSFDAIYHEFTGCETDFQSLVFRSKGKTLRTSLLSELNALTGRLQYVAGRSRYGQDFTWSQLREALAGIVAAFPVYRTYVRESSEATSLEDSAQVQRAMDSLNAAQPDLNQGVLQFIHNLLQLKTPPDLDEACAQACREFVMRFQQLTGPVMAKGLEDTAFYIYNRFISLNEVGGDPGSFGTGLKAFHTYNRARAKHWPHSLNATATHDTKRGEDLRARLNVLSEMPQEWSEAVRRWREINAGAKVPVGTEPAPHPNDEYLLYQTLAGAWIPEADGAGGLQTFRERISAYLLKAIREAKERTSWTDSNAAYENACRNFVETVLADGTPNRFIEVFKPFQRKVAFFGYFNSLSQTLLKLTAPGVPDIYQGTELWDFSLVDPDNRRPVDYEIRRRWLAELKTLIVKGSDRKALLERLLKESPTGQIKLYLTWLALQFRRDRQQLYENGDYLPLITRGAKEQHVCAFARTMGDEMAITIAPRLVMGLLNGVPEAPTGQKIWQDTSVTLPGHKTGATFENVLTGEVLASEQNGLPLARACAIFPVALLRLR